MLKMIAKPFLWLVTCAIPVFISACYGSGYDSDVETELLEGNVKNAAGEGIPNIQLTCISKDGVTNNQTYSQSDGSFSIPSRYDLPCLKLRFEDVDGNENGLYSTLDLSLDDQIDEIEAVMQEKTE